MTTRVDHHAVHHQVSQDALDGQVTTAMNESRRGIGTRQLTCYLQLGRTTLQPHFHTPRQIAIISGGTHDEATAIFHIVVINGINGKRPGRYPLHRCNTHYNVLGHLLRVASLRAIYNRYLHSSSLLLS